MTAKRKTVECSLTIEVDALPPDADRPTVEVEVDHQLAVLREQAINLVVEQLDVRRAEAAKKAAAAA
jgi:hypothetical protein